MTVRSVVLILLSLFALLFLILNWSGITAPVPVDLLYTKINAPLGLILLVVLGGMWLAGVLWVLLQQAGMLYEIRRAHRDAASSRGLADHAERSRFEESKKALREELERIQEAIEERARRTNESLDGAHQELLGELRDVKTAVAELSARLNSVAISLGVDPATLSGEPERSTLLGIFGGKRGKTKRARPAPAPRPAAPEAAPKAPDAPTEPTQDK